MSSDQMTWWLCTILCSSSMKKFYVPDILHSVNLVVAINTFGCTGNEPVCYNMCSGDAHFRSSLQVCLQYRCMKSVCTRSAVVLDGDDWCQINHKYNCSSIIHRNGRFSDSAATSKSLEDSNNRQLYSDVWHTCIVTPMYEAWLLLQNIINAHQHCRYNKCCTLCNY